jgi:putative FmdB family regulatory protein
LEVKNFRDSQDKSESKARTKLNSLSYFKEVGKMPIYEYKSKNGAHCTLCKERFEVTQRMNDKPLTRCPECGSEIRKVFSRPFLSRRKSFSREGAYNYMEDDADELGLEEDLGEGEVWA